jgi:hypothetical protein
MIPLARLSCRFIETIFPRHASRHTAASTPQSGQFLDFL